MKVWRERPPITVFILVGLVIFALMHSLIPADPRVRMGSKPFSPEFGVSPNEIWYAVKKWRHIIWFAIFFPMARSLFAKRATLKAIGLILAVSVLIEFEECFVAGRYGRLVDLLPNLIGAWLGALVWSVWLRRKSRQKG